MELLSYFIEWFGVLLLSIEAIKLDNLKKLIPILYNMRIALNSPYAEGESGQRMVYKAPEGYETLRKYANAIIYVLGLIIILVLLVIFHLLLPVAHLLSNHVLVFSGVPWYRIALSVWLFWVLFFVPFYIGNQFVIYFSAFADNYYHLMIVLERNTFNGIIGIIGFLMVTISTVINMATH